MRLGALWAAIRGYPAPPPADEKPPVRPRGQPCTPEEMDARIKALSDYIEREIRPKPVSVPKAAVETEAPDSPPDSLRTWFVLKSLNDAQLKDARDQQPPKPSARPNP